MKLVTLTAEVTAGAWHCTFPLRTFVRCSHKWDVSAVHNNSC